MHKHGEGVHDVAVPKVSEVSIVAALSDRGVRYSSRSRESSNGGRPRVEIRFKARQLHTEELEDTLGSIYSALQVEGVAVVTVPDGFGVSIMAALSYMGVLISTRSNNSTLGRLRVEASC